MSIRVLDADNYRITNGFTNHLMSGKWARGVDLVKEVGCLVNTCYITAHSAGKVIKVVNYISGHELDREGMGYGNYVMIDHGDYITLYAHMVNVVVKEGAIVGKGAILGYMGDTGNSYGSHLHFEIRNYCTDYEYGLHDDSIFTWLDPTEYLETDLPGGASDFVEDYSPHYYRVRKSWEDAKSQIGAYHYLSKALAVAEANPGYKVFNESGLAYVENADIIEITYSDYEPGTSDYYRVRKSWNDPSSQRGAFKSYTKAVALAETLGGYHVYDKDGIEIY